MDATQYTEMRNSLTRQIRTLRACPKCGGKGEIRAYAHVKGGECYRCGGTGVASNKRTHAKISALELEVAALDAARAAAVEAVAAAYTPEQLAVIAAIGEALRAE